MFKKILIPTDGSELSDKAASGGVELARTVGARTVGVHVFPSSFGVYYGEAVWVDDKVQLQMRETAEAEGNRYLDRVQARAEAASVPFERVLVESDSPWKGIVDTAHERGCDLIVMAAHGRRGLAAVMLGSETNRVLTHSRVPVLVYR
jgi:nucleotide-binding universal stress UspA family protein